MQRRLLLHREIPYWQKDNEYIWSGYRPASGSLWISYLSLSYLHNQTVNIFSHLIGSLVFAILPIYFYEEHFKSQPHARPGDLLVVTIYCFGVALCFAFSATFHILSNHSRSLARLWNTLDYLGIIVLMWGAGIPMIYFGFLCQRTLRWLYWMIISVTAGCCSTIMLHPRFISARFRKWRAGFFTVFGSSSLIFIIHGIAVNGWVTQKARMPLLWMTWTAVTNLAGAAVYAARIPERWIPYRFDLFGASHQIFHVAVLVAAVIHFLGLLGAFQHARLRRDVCLGSEFDVSFRENAP